MMRGGRRITWSSGSKPDRRWSRNSKIFTTRSDLKATSKASRESTALSTHTRSSWRRPEEKSPAASSARDDKSALPGDDAEANPSAAPSPPVVNAAPESPAAANRCASPSWRLPPSSPPGPPPPPSSSREKSARHASAARDLGGIHITCRPSCQPDAAAEEPVEVPAAAEGPLSPEVRSLKATLEGARPRAKKGRGTSESLPTSTSAVTAASRVQMRPRSTSRGVVEPSRGAKAWAWTATRLSTALPCSWPPDATTRS
mmetsp:Transcript_69964/g.158183  ORF Transcript_69964/g.158183 Transcript_69964/m.158183 type:complete len:258 (-) Transcript_69964:192-965(-)